MRDNLDLRIRQFSPQHIIVLVLFNLFGLQFAKSQSVTISGFVTEKRSGEAAIGVNVLIYQDTATTPGQRLFRGASTNKFGFYSIPSVPVGSCRIVVRGVGYGIASDTFFISTSEKEVRKNLQIPQLSIEMAEVVVEGVYDESKTEALSTIDIKTDFARHMPSLGGEIDVFRVLQLLPGVKSVSEISSGLYIRGGSPDQNLILLDGVIVYNPFHLGGFLSAFNPDALLNTRLIKGAFPAEYGGRLSSVLDLTMREGTRERLSGSAAINLINSRLMLEGPIGEDVTFMIAGRRMYLDLFIALANLKDTPRYYFYDLNTKVNLKISESDRLFASGYFGRDVLAPPEGETSDFNVRWGNSTANFRWTHLLMANAFMNSSLIFTNYKFFTDSEDEGDVTELFRAVSEIQDVTWRAEVQYIPNDVHSIKLGGELTRHSFNVGANNDAGSTIFGLTTQRLSSHEAALFLQDDWNPSPMFSADVGTRLYYFEKGNYVSLEPRISTSMKFSDQFTVKSSFAVAHQFLHLIIRNDISLPTDLWFPSTENVKPSRCMQTVVGIETKQFGDEYLLAVEGYYKEYKNLYEYRDRAVFALGAPLESQFTQGTGKAYGIEFFLNKQLGSITGWLGYALSWTTRHFPELNRGREFYPRYDRRHDIALAAMYRISDGWEFGATWMYGTGQAYTMPTGQFYFEDIEGLGYLGSGWQALDYSQRNAYRLPAFHKLDLNFIRKFSWFNLPFQFSINVYNAYNRKNPFAQSIRYRYNYEVDPGGNTYRSVIPVPQVVQYTLFPIIPTIGLSVTF
ncbi:MAG: TonB-dependent receptor [Ignavibacteriales bacterium]|nr:TonB-dependent receptor [Ignavibacteriales bacterium]